MEGVFKSLQGCVAPRNRPAGQVRDEVAVSICVPHRVQAAGVLPSNDITAANLFSRDRCGPGILTNSDGQIVYFQRWACSDTVVKVVIPFKLSEAIRTK